MASHKLLLNHTFRPGERLPATLAGAQGGSKLLLLLLLFLCFFLLKSTHVHAAITFATRTAPSAAPVRFLKGQGLVYRARWRIQPALVKLVIHQIQECLISYFISYLFQYLLRVFLYDFLLLFPPISSFARLTNCSVRNVFWKDSSWLTTTWGKSISASLKPTGAALWAWVFTILMQLWGDFSDVLEQWQ